MSKAGAIEKLRLVYIEPNEYAAQRGAKFGADSKPGDNITWDPEDFNISVDLQVVVPNRNDCAQEEYIPVNIQRPISNNSPYVSFLQGTNIDPKSKNGHSLTTSYTDASYTEIKNHQVSNTESIGISSIDIKFDAHFYPQVTMKFTDVRGYSLFMPAEEEYVEGLKTQAYNKGGFPTPGRAYTNFFKAVFHFPYPRFLLTIKGFYGNRITFVLAVNDFKTAFNGQSGNFDVTISFIGYMYGLYTDIPMSYILCAPYIDLNNTSSSTLSTNTYWNNSVSEGRFVSMNGESMPTLLDFARNYIDLGSKITGDSISGTVVGEILNLETDKTTLENIKTKIGELVNTIGKVDGSGEIVNDGKIEINDAGVYIYMHTAGNRLVFDANKAKELKRVINNYNNNTTYASYKIKDYCLVTGFGTVDDQPASEAEKECCKLLTCTNNKFTDLFEKKNDKWVLKGDLYYCLHTIDRGDLSYSIILNNVEKEYVNDKINEFAKSKNIDDLYCTTILVDGYYRHIDKIITSINGAIESKRIEATKVASRIYSDSLGYTNSIENIYRLIFAHIDCFFHEYKKVLTQIKTDQKNKKRTLNSLGLNVSDTDLKVSTDATDADIPPYPGIFNEYNGTRKVIDPREKNSKLKDIPEIKFVDALLRAAKLVGSEANDITKLSEEMVDDLTDNTTYSSGNSESSVMWSSSLGFTVKTPSTFYPITICDALLNDKNPYSNLSIKNTDTVLTMFVNRLNAVILSTYAVELKNTKIRNALVKAELANVIDKAKINLFSVDNPDYLRKLEKYKKEIGESENGAINFFIKHFMGANSASVFGSNFKLPLELGTDNKVKNVPPLFPITGIDVSKYNGSDEDYSANSQYSMFGMKGIYVLEDISCFNEFASTTGITIDNDSKVYINSGEREGYNQYWKEVNRTIVPNTNLIIRDNPPYEYLREDNYDLNQGCKTRLTYVKENNRNVLSKYSTTEYSYYDYCGLPSGKNSYYKFIHGIGNESNSKDGLYLPFIVAYDNDGKETNMLCEPGFYNLASNTDKGFMLLSGLIGSTENDVLFRTGYSHPSVFSADKDDNLKPDDYEHLDLREDTIRVYKIRKAVALYYGALIYRLRKQIKGDSDIVKFNGYKNNGLGFSYINRHNINSFAYPSCYKYADKPNGSLIYSDRELVQTSLMLLSYYKQIDGYAILTKEIDKISDTKVSEIISEIRNARISDDDYPSDGDKGKDPDKIKIFKNNLEVLLGDEGSIELENYFKRWCNSTENDGLQTILNELETNFVEVKTGGASKTVTLRNEKYVTLYFTYDSGRTINFKSVLYGSKLNDKLVNLMTGEVCLFCLTPNTLTGGYSGNGINKYIAIAVQSFINGLYSYYSNSSNNKTTSATQSTTTYSTTTDSSSTDSNLSLSDESRVSQKSLYYTLKNLYDKWICSYGSLDRFSIQDPRTEEESRKKRYGTNDIADDGTVKEINNFIYVDSLYNNIGNEFYINPQTLYNLIISVSKGENNWSIYQFLNKLAQDNKLLMRALPVYNNFYRADGLEEIFTPHECYNTNQRQSMGFGSTYIIMYTHEMSKHLSDESTKEIGFEDDGIDLAGSIHYNKVDAKLFKLQEGEKVNYMVPAFGVTYGMQNQQYFKGINVNMDNPVTTDYSILNTLQLSQTTSAGDRNIPFGIGQNIYAIYSNRSYQCTVEMMGCANIMPMMYFQLNNIPMFKGAYMIINVSHSIKAGNMTTQFTGVRVSKNIYPFVTDSLILSELLERIKRNGGSSGSSARTQNTYTPAKGYAIITEEYARSLKYPMVINGKKTWGKLTPGDRHPICRELYRSDLQYLWTECGGTPPGNKNDMDSLIGTARIRIHKENQQVDTIEVRCHKALIEKVQNVFNNVIFNTKIDGKYFEVRDIVFYSWRCVDEDNSTGSLSIHSWAVAFDMNTHFNPFRRKMKWEQYKTAYGAEDDYLRLRTWNHPVVKALAEAGFGWGMYQHSIDPMHFSVATFNSTKCINDVGKSHMCGH